MSYVHTQAHADGFGIDHTPILFKICDHEHQMKMKKLNRESSNVKSKYANSILFSFNCGIRSSEFRIVIVDTASTRGMAQHNRVMKM